MAAPQGVRTHVLSGTGTLGEVLSASDGVTGYAAGQLVLTSGTITVQCQGSFDGGSTWVALQLVNMNDATTATGVSASGIHRADVGAIPRFRWQVTAASSPVGFFYECIREG